MNNYYSKRDRTSPGLIGIMGDVFSQCAIKTKRFAVILIQKKPPLPLSLVAQDMEQHALVIAVRANK